MTKTVAIIDDHEIVREGIKLLLSQYDMFKVIFDAESPQSIPDQSENIDIVILDLSFNLGLCDLSSIDYVKSKIPGSDILVFSMMDESIFGLDVIKYGVKGFVSKNSSGQHLIQGLKTVSEGGVYLSNKLSELLAKQFSKPEKALIDHLSQREKEVLILLGGGESIKSISERLYLSVKTISTYKYRIMSKLKLKNIAEIVHCCIENKLLVNPKT